MANENRCAHGAQIDFGDLTLYLCRNQSGNIFMFLFPKKIACHTKFIRLFRTRLRNLRYLGAGTNPASNSRDLAFGGINRFHLGQKLPVLERSVLFYFTL